MKCGYCGNDAAQVCSRCKSIAYCNAEHQRLHWLEHKKSCKKFLSSPQAAANASSSSPSSTPPSSLPIMKSCQCMFCGEQMVLASEEEAVRHMEVCLALQEQLNDTTNQFTLPNSLKSTVNTSSPHSSSSFK